MIVTRSLTANEPDLLIGNEAVKLFIKDLSGDELAEYSAPVDGWTHDKLEALERDTFLLRILMDGMRFSVSVG